MIEAEFPENEVERLAALHDYGVLDTEAEQAWDDLTRIASEICGTPIALVSLVDADRQWFKSKVGLDAPETPRRVAFCSHAILAPDDILVVPDSLEDVRFKDNPLVVGEPRVRFYAGAPLVDGDGLAMGTLCVIDHTPRELTPTQLETLRALSRQVVSQLELRKHNASLRKLTDEVQRKNGELQQFTSLAAHDLREPLRKLVAFSGLLRQDLGDDLPEQASEDLAYIVDAAERMDGLVESLLELSRAGSGRLTSEWVDLEDCARRAIEILSAPIAETNADVEVEPLPSVQGDETLLTQIFQNLIGNALKFTENERPTVRVTSRLEDGERILCVQDDGIGVDVRHVEAIFAPFKRLHGRQAYEGTGIGLAIVQKVVERHGGRIWVESAPGEGAQFKFTLAGVRDLVDA